ncbi:hypothetical protein G9U51_10875 [Calidifontibacter sp. DB0510]|uniref:Alpha/beta hydrolase n=1 Tax=Metallococcus carri TaxID=1656884 RepID=A0A967B2E1_9MICO|nr:hypothetical protein [Metallococcus carri]NHN56278.1 hypothetical protein [Metallococcus carri]NOP38670.1 hypothetical protein [Calidifontibacter sp. DB2511S]
MRRWVLALVVLTLTACGGSATQGGSGASTGPPASSASSTTSDPPPTAESSVTSPTSTAATPDPSRYSCVTRAERSRLISVPAKSGAFDAYVAGAGSVGVVLSHQSDGDLCQFHDYANTLAARGYRVIAVTNEDFSTEVVTVAAAYLRRKGTNSTVLIGASRGGTISIAAAPSVPDVKAVVALSAPATYFDLDARTTIARLTCPIFIAVGGGDTQFVSSARELRSAAKKSKRVEYVEVPGDDRHGVGFITGTPTVGGPLTVFLLTYAPAG